MSAGPIDPPPHEARHPLGRVLHDERLLFEVHESWLLLLLKRQDLPPNSSNAGNNAAEATRLGQLQVLPDMVSQIN